MKQELFILILGEVPRSLQGEVFPPHLATSAPAYSASRLPRQVTIGQESVEVGGVPVSFELRGYPPDILLIQARVPVASVFTRDVFDLEEALLGRARTILKTYGGDIELSEEYSVFVVSEFEGEPEQFLRHASVIAGLLKSERRELDGREVAYTLQSQIKYAKNDLALVDWDGAFLFDVDGDVNEELTLLTLGNLQLLRHRILDRHLDSRLQRMSELVARSARARFTLNSRELGKDLVKLVQNRLQSITDLQRLERDVKLIGDWYSARFYDLVAGKFKIEDWRRTIRTKLEALEGIYSIVEGNFTISAKHRAEWAQIILFFILQVGWFLLIILEFFYFTR